jgi:DNA-binding LacI/PurR family transcriptional regulator
MTETEAAPGRLLAKQSVITENLKRAIVEGRLVPGGRLPTQINLAESFRVSGVTIQRALDKLMREGFITTRGRNGTFVVDHPPHLHRYGVVFCDAPGAGRSRYHELLEENATRLPGTAERNIRIFNGISGKEDSENSRELLSLVRSHQLAGLLLIDGDAFINTPLLDEAGIYRAAVMSCQTDTLNCPIVFPDLNGMIDLALDKLYADGRRRVAMLLSVPLHKQVGAHLRNAMLARRMDAQDRWIQILPHDYPLAVRNAVLLLLNSSKEERPDALFIVDDDLIDPAVSGVIAAGGNVLDEVELVVTTNFPRPEPVVPMHRIGFNTSELLETAIKLIDAQRQGDRVPMTTRVSAHVEAAEAGLRSDRRTRHLLYERPMRR